LVGFVGVIIIDKFKKENAGNSIVVAGPYLLTTTSFGEKEEMVVMEHSSSEKKHLSFDNTQRRDGCV